MKKIGIFGITGNPPHNGHLDVIKQAAASFDEVWITPVFIHPFSKKTVDYEHRVNMINLLLLNSNLTNVFLKELDKEYYSCFKKIPYSYFLLCWLSKTNPLNKFSLIIGADNSTNEIWSKFKHSNLLNKKFNISVFIDSGTHSTSIRNYIKNNLDCSSFLPHNIIKYIYSNNLYKE